MGKISSQTPAPESAHKPAQEQETVFYFEVLGDEITPRPGLTPMGYDDEIGLWEERLHRANQRKIDAQTALIKYK
jgi:hypothetical protein